MRIAEIEVDRFGIWNHARVDNIGPGLTVFYGPNETGKTTLMQFVRSVLHGFPPERRERYAPATGQSAGGSLTVAHEGQRFALARELDGEGHDRGLSIRAASGDLAPAERLREILGHVDEPVFNNVFVLGLHDLQRLANLTDTRASEFLFRIAGGIDRVSLHEVMDELADSRNRLLSPDERPSEIMHLHAQAERLRGELRELGGLTRQYGELLARQRETGAELKHARTARQTASDALDRLRLAHSLLPAWHRRASLDEQIAAIGETRSIPAEALDELRRLDEERARHKQDLSRARSQMQTLAARLAAEAFNEEFWSQAARAEALVDQREWIANLEAQVDAAAEEVNLVAARLDGERRRTGFTHQGSGQPISKKQLAGLRRVAIELRDARRQLKELEERGTQHHQSLAALDQQLVGGLTGRDEASLTDALEKQGQIVNQLRHRLELDERAEQLSQHSHDLEAQRLDLLEKQVIPGWVMGTVGGFFAMGICLLLAGLVLPLPMSGTLSLGLAGIGALGAVGAGAAKFLIEQANQRKLERCENQLVTLAAQLRQNREEREEIDQNMPRGAGPLTMRLQSAEADLAKLEELIPLNARRQSLARDREAQERTAEELRQRIAARRGEWNAGLKAAGLPADFPPAKLKTLRRSNSEIERLREQLSARERELEQRRAGIAQFAERVAPLVGLAGISVPGKRVAEQLAFLNSALTSIRGQAEDREAARRENALAKRRERKLRRTLGELRSRRTQLLRECGVEHEEELRRARARHEKLLALKAQREEAHAEVTNLLAGRFEEIALADWLTLAEAPEIFAARSEEYAGTIAACEARADELSHTLGELNERIKQLVADRRLPNKQLELATTEARLKQATERWQVLGLSWSLLDKLRRDYEVKRQPETLRRASYFFGRLTGERYRRVWTPLGEMHLLVEDARGEMLPVEVLSRGTREQLFLALRLALAEAYARRGLKFPLVLDDLLVNFDRERARLAALVLRDFANEGHQVLLFTCHEHLLRLFQAEGIAVRGLPGVVIDEPAPTRLLPAPVEIAAVVVDEAASEPIPVVEPKRKKKLPEEPAPVVVEERRPPRRRETIVERPRMPAAPDTSWDAEDFAGEFAERRVATWTIDRDEAA